MATTKKPKKNLIVSYKNLPDDLKEKFKEAYPEGYSNYITRFVKPNGDSIFVVPFDTPDTAYMVKFDVKVDTLAQDLDKALFDDDEPEGKEDEFAPLSEAIEKEEENTSHRERHLRHGDFEDIFDDEEKKKKATLGIDKEGLKAAFGDDEDADELDSYEKIGEDDDDDPDDDYEPSDDDLRGIEEEYLDAEIPPLDATIPEDEMVVIGKPAKKAAKTKAAPSKPSAKAAAKPVAKPAARPAVKTASRSAAKPAVAKKPAVKKAVAPKTAKTKKK
jgi:hypothetical protein